MLSYLPLLIIVLFGVGAFYASRARIGAAPGQSLPGLPGHYGWYGTLWTVVPATLVYAAWAIIDGQIIRNIVLSDHSGLSGAEATLLFVSIENAAAGVMTEDVPWRRGTALKARELSTAAASPW